MVVDAGREQDGVWIEYDETTKFKLGSLSSRRYKQAYQSALDKIRQGNRRVTPEQAEEIQLQVISEAVVLDWQGVQMQGAEYPCLPANVHFVIKNCPQVREFIIAAAGNYENFKAEKLEAAKSQLGEA